MPRFCLVVQISRTLSIQHMLAVAVFCPVSRAESQIGNLALCRCALGDPQVKFSEYGSGNLQVGLISINGFVEFFLKGGLKCCLLWWVFIVCWGIYRSTCHLVVKPCSVLYRNGGLTGGRSFHYQTRHKGFLSIRNKKVNWRKFRWLYCCCESGMILR